MIRIRFKKLDDEMHFWAGMIVWFCVFVLANFAFEQWASSVIGFIAAASIGVVKEIYDDRIKETVFDWRDLKWTVIGAAIPAFLFIIFDIIYYFSKP
jgi:ABC-type microcin C transport system permease subunit YejB